MSALTKRAVERVLGPVDDTMAAELEQTGASESELREAHVWLLNDEALVNELRPFPKGRVAELVDILKTLENPAGAEE